MKRILLLLLVSAMMASAAIAQPRQAAGEPVRTSQHGASFKARYEGGMFGYC